MKRKQVETRNRGLGIEMIGTSCTGQPVSKKNHRLTFLVFILQVSLPDVSNSKSASAVGNF